MKRYEEICDPKSCLNTAKDQDLIFVLIERDIAMPETLRFWANKRIELGKNSPNDKQIISALEMANEIEKKQKSKE